jgi:hypothetical protein
MTKRNLHVTVDPNRVSVRATKTRMERTANAIANARQQPPAAPPNNPIKLSVRAVTRLACASRAPAPPAAYRVR